MLRSMKEHTPTPESRTFVREATSARISQDKICRSIGITVPTLRKHYQAELDKGTMVVPQLAINKVIQFLQQEPEGRFALAMQKEQAKVALEALKSHGFSSAVDLSVTSLPRIVTNVIKDSEDNNE